MATRKPRFTIAKVVLGPLPFLLFPALLHALEVPQLTGRVVDRAGVLPSGVAASLAAQLAVHEQRFGNQVAVLVIPSLEGEALEDYSHRVATTWRLGQKGQDNGVLLLIAVQDRKIRIEVGYGLEGSLTDAKSARIIRNEIVPRFRAGDFPGGISAGVTAILGTIEDTYAPRDATGSPASDLGGIDLFILAVIIGIIVGALVGGQWKPGGIVGSLIAFFMTSPLGWFLAFVAGGLVLAVLLLLSGRMTGRRGRRGDDIWFTPGWGHAGGGGLPGGGDIFSGGGGDFGGGGASGRW
jgi:uncharacterized protein